MCVKFINYALLISAIFSYPLANAQNSNVEFRGGIPLAPSGLANHPLGDGPFEYPTAEGMDIRVVVVTKDIEYPMSLAFLPDNKILVITRTGQIRVINDGILDPEPASGGPESVFRGESGLPGTIHGYLDIALHPQFAQNGLIYLCYTKPLGDDERATTVGRGRWNGTGLSDFTDIWQAPAGISSAARITFGQNNMLFIATGGGDAQNLSSYGGKILRLHDDGSVPSDNPFVGRAGAKPEIYSMGHRNSLGLAVHPNGDLWQNENGPNGGDEINIIQAGLNYGWPIVSLGRTYQGPWQSERPTHAIFEPPIVYWMPAIAVSGMAFYTGDALPKWKGDVFVGALRTGEIPGTGHLERILFNENMEELRRENLLVDLRQRIRDVRQGPDGLLYVVTDEKDGAVLRIEPAD